MKIRIQFHTDSAAFEDGFTYEVGEILGGIASMIERGHFELTPGAGFPLRDSNGHRVGLIEVSEEA
jgi:hypothetical protein